MSRGIVFHGRNIWFDLQTCFKVIDEDGAIGLPVFYSNFGRMSYRFCASGFYAEMTLLGDVTYK